jgi:hypothetical protein
MGAYPGSLTTQGRVEQELKAHASLATPDDCHLRSSNAVIGHPTDGDIGHLEDLLIDDHAWAIRYLVVNTSNWWGGHRVLVPPEWITDVSWPEARISVDLTRQAVKNAPPYESAAGVDRQLEQAIYEHYDRPGYWITSTTQRRRRNEARHAGVTPVDAGRRGTANTQLGANDFRP